MKPSFLAAALGVMFLAPAADPVLAATNPNVILVDNGITQFKLGKHRMLAVRAQRDNGNAHGFEVVSFYETGPEPDAQLNLVSVFSSGPNEAKEAYHVSVSGGADCVLHDFRLVKPQGKKPAQLIVAHRDAGASYADEATVRFTYYELVENDEQLGPPVYFMEKKKSVARRKFCDVNEAFEQELRLGLGSGVER